MISQGAGPFISYVSFLGFFGTLCYWQPFLLSKLSTIALSLLYCFPSTTPKSFDKIICCRVLNNKFLFQTLQNHQAPENYSVTREIPVPSVFATMGTHSSVIRIHYELECELVPEGLLECNHTLKLPITIGTIPILPMPSSLLSQALLLLVGYQGPPVNLNPDQGASLNLNPDWNRT